MRITTREMPATPVVVGSRRYTPVAGDTTASFPVPGGLLRAGYARPLHIKIEDGTNTDFIPIPDRQMQIMLGALLVVVLARLIERRRRT